MRSILPEILSLIQHNQLVEKNIEEFRPPQCLSCGKAGLWLHGHYDRQADYNNLGSASLNPIAIPRFYCPSCHKTCSVLPECIPPHRHYPWLIQQAIFLLLLSGLSYQSSSQATKPSRWTISRWWRRLKSQFSMHASHFNSIQPMLGRLTECIEYWHELLKQQRLSQVMLSLNNAGVIIP